MAELAYAHDSKSCVLTGLWVQLPPRALYKDKDSPSGVFVFDIAGRRELNGRSHATIVIVATRPGPEKSLSDGEMIIEGNSAS